MKVLPIFLPLIFVVGCGRPYQRFIPASGSVTAILVDTKTGRLCDGSSPQHPIGDLPLCYDLYKGK
jgi:hypothetical protein